MLADPAEPGQSHPPSPDRALLGCGGADTACPELAERRHFHQSKKTGVAYIASPVPHHLKGLFRLIIKQNMPSHLPLVVSKDFL